MRDGSIYMLAAANQQASLHVHACAWLRYIRELASVWHVELYYSETASDIAWSN